MTSLARAVALVVAALALVVVAGCGSDTKESNNYVNAINKAQTDFANNVQKIGSASASGSDPAAAAKKTFQDLDAAINKVVADLKAVDPPDKVKDLHDQLVSELGQFESQVKKAGDSLGSGDPQAIVKAQTTFASSASSLGTQISKTINDINSKLQG
jgi:hypothetical protein